MARCVPLGARCGRAVFLRTDVSRTKIVSGHNENLVVGYCRCNGRQPAGDNDGSSSSNAECHVVSTAAGTGAAVHADGPGSAATFNYPFGIAVAPDGSGYVACKKNHSGPEGLASRRAHDDRGKAG